MGLFVCCASRGRQDLPPLILAPIGSRYSIFPLARYSLEAGMMRLVYSIAFTM